MPIMNDGRYLADEGMGGISATVTTLPVGWNVGEVRTLSGVTYRLCFNAGGASITVGSVASPVPLGGGGYASVTVTTVSGLYNNMGAVVAMHATVPTASYFWGATKGAVGGLIAAASSVPTGSAIYIAANGQVDLLPSIVTTASNNVYVGFNMGGAASKTATTGTRSGDFFVNLE